MGNRVRSYKTLTNRIISVENRPTRSNSYGGRAWPTVGKALASMDFPDYQVTDTGFGKRQITGEQISLSSNYAINMPWSFKQALNWEIDCREVMGIGMLSDIEAYMVVSNSQHNTTMDRHILIHYSLPDDWVVIKPMLFCKKHDVLFDTLAFEDGLHVNFGDRAEEKMRLAIRQSVTECSIGAMSIESFKDVYLTAERYFRLTLWCLGMSRKQYNEYLADDHQHARLASLACRLTDPLEDKSLYDLYLTLLKYFDESKAVKMADGNKRTELQLKLTGAVHKSKIRTYTRLATEASKSNL